SACPFYIGGISNSAAGSCSNVAGFFNGLIDEVSYYTRALSQSEIQFIFLAGGSGKCALAHPPLITSQPLGATIYAGASVTFNVAATGDAPLGYQWQFNGSILTGQTSNSLTFTNVQSAKAGNYTVSVINAAGS